MTERDHERQSSRDIRRRPRDSRCRWKCFRRATTASSGSARPCAALWTHMAARGWTRRPADAAAGVMRYFDTAAKDHHADEEVGPVPRAHRVDGGLGRGLPAGDHRGPGSGASGNRVAMGARACCARAHRRRQGRARWHPPTWRHWPAPTSGISSAKKTELLPMAARLLSDESLDVIGRAMRMRRGIEL